jgi:hypothetical protein
VVVTPRHFAANAAGVRLGWVVTLPFPTRRPGGRLRPECTGAGVRVTAAGAAIPPARAWLASYEVSSLRT